jgi:hypothetical protein
MVIPCACFFVYPAVAQPFSSLAVRFRPFTCAVLSRLSEASYAFMILHPVRSFCLFETQPLPHRSGSVFAIILLTTTTASTIMSITMH